MKKTYAVMALLIVLILATVAFPVTITKGLIGKEDIDLTQTDNATAETFSRATSTGASITLTKLNGTHIPWDNAYTRTIRPLHITGKAGTSVLSNFLTGTFSGTVSMATLTASGNATVGGTLGVTGNTTITGTHAAASYSGGTLTLTGDLTAGGNIVGDAATTITGMAQIDIDGKSFDTGTTAPASGTWVAGDIVYNSAPTALTTIAATGAIGWQCVTGGTPGTWRPIFPVFVATPDNAAMTCTAGMTAIDNSYIYACYATNTWKRVGITTW